MLEVVFVTTGDWMAVVDALKAYGVRDISMPVTAEKIWRAIRETKANDPSP